MKPGKSQPKIILAIESSCDETAAAILRGAPKSTLPNYKILSSIVKSQIALHRKTGGVVPEVAARAHIKNILPITQLALRRAKLKMSDVDYLAVTAGPGLVVSLLVGVEFVKGLSLASGKLIIPVNHMAGHLYSAFSGKFPISNFQFPIVALIVSGGHTMLVVMRDWQDYRVIGQTVDDAAGEAFDKVARLLGLPYPGGPSISRLAKRGKPSINFTRPMLNDSSYNFSFSGLKTAVRYYLESHPHLTSPIKGEESAFSSLPLVGRAREGLKKADIAKSFEAAVIDVLVTKTMRAAKQYKAKTVSLGGGVAANQALRLAMAKSCRDNKLALAIATPELCTDNAAMIAMAAYFQLRTKTASVPTAQIKADPGWELATSYSKINRA